MSNCPVTVKEAGGVYEQMGIHIHSSDPTKTREVKIVAEAKRKAEADLFKPAGWFPLQQITIT